MPAAAHSRGVDDAYKCCCNECHVLTGAKIVGAVLFVLRLVGLALALVGDEQASILYYILLFAGVGSAGAIFYAIRTNDGRWLTPELVLSALQLTLIILATITIAILLIGGKDERQEIADINNEKAAINGDGGTLDEDYPNTVYALALIFGLIGVAANGWWFSIVYRSFKFLRDQKPTAEEAVVFSQAEPLP